MNMHHKTLRVRGDIPETVSARLLRDSSEAVEREEEEEDT